MLETERGRVIMADAWALYADAIKMLDQGYIRNAAEKAWGAAKRATDALILERTGHEPQRSSQTSGGIRSLGQESEALASLRTRYSHHAHYVHGDCFYDGQCEPEDFFIGLIRSTDDYIRDAERLAEGADGERC